MSWLAVEDLRWKLSIVVVGILGWMLLFSPDSLALPPANDNFGEAEALSGFPVSRSGTNLDASQEGGEPEHDFREVGQSVWFFWIAPSSAIVTIDTCGSDFDTVLAVYTGTALANLVKVGSSNWSRGPVCPWARQGEVTFKAAAGTTYWIAVDGALEVEWEEEEFETEGPDPEGEIDLRIAATPPPENDDFADAEELSFEPEWGYFTGGLNLAASKQAGEPAHAGDQGGASVWYVWTAPHSGTVIADTCYSDFDTLLAVYTGNVVSGLTPVASDDDGSSCESPQSRVTFQATGGTTYRIAVDGAFDAGKGAAMGELWLDLWQRPENDNFDSPVVLPSSTNAVHSQSTAFATDQLGEPTHAGGFGGASVWFSWTAPGTGTVNLDTCGSGFDTLLAVYTGSAVGSLTPVAGNNDSARPACGFIGQSELTFAATAGAIYRIAVDGLWAEWGDLTLRLSETLAPPAPPPASGPEPSADPSPDTRIDKIVVRPKKRMATAFFSATGPVGTFTCGLDGRTPVRCSSPKVFKRLSPGRHKLTVTAVSGAGRADPTPAIRNFRSSRARQHASKRAPAKPNRNDRAA